jgi:hypothetical protein
MSSERKNSRAICILVLALTAGLAFGQTVNSRIIGTLADPANALIPNARLTLTQKATRAVRSATSNESGLFRFLDLPPGEYALRIEAQGFKSQDIAAITLASTETRDLGTIMLQLGATTESIYVTAEATPVQTASSERGGLIDGSQLTSMTLKGRDAFGFLALLPGVIDTNASRDTSTNLSMYQISINGQTSQKKNVMIDGVTSMDWGGNYSTYVTPNLETIAEIRVITNVPQAEFGRQNGGNVNVITKSGTTEFHGSGYWNRRHENLNANTFFNNRSGVTRPIYRYTMFGYGVGGPIYIPKLFNTSRQKLFFFVSEEFTKMRTPSSTSTANMPTALERSGDFSNSRDAAGNLIVIKDYNTGAPFPSNKIPASQINSMGQSILNLFPQPSGYINPAPGQQYTANFLANETGYNKRRNDMARIDILPRQNMSLFLRAGRDENNVMTPFQIGPGLGGRVTFTPGYIFTARLTQTISPTMVNEVSFGLGHNNYGFYHTVDDSAYFRTSALNPPTLRTAPLDFCEDADPKACYNLPKPYLPRFTFSGGSLASPVSYNPGSMTPYKNSNDNTVITDNFSVLVGNHTLKTGIYVEKNVKTEPDSGVYYMGYYNFGRNTNNPLDSNHGYANALLGIFNSYAEGSNTLMPHFYGWNTESYVQDSWRVGRRLTLDLGVRWVHMGVYHDDKNTLSGFYPQLWNPAQAARLYWPAVAGGQSVALDKVTGNTTYPVLVNTIVPGSGNVANGMHVNGLTGKGDFYTTPFLVFTPRIGFAWDVTGDGKTAIRGSFGQFSNLYHSGLLADTQFAAPPVQYNPTIYYGTLSQVAQAGGNAAVSAVNGSGMYGDQAVETSNQVNLTVQRSVGFNTVVDIGYVGNFDRHALQSISINPIPLHAYADPANIVNNAEVQANLLRTAYPGMGDLSYQSASLSSLNYHALQAQAQHRMSHGLQFGVSYTFSKALGTQGWDAYHSQREWWYGPTTYDRTHNLAINYVCSLPSTGSRFGRAKHVLNDWVLTGITTFQTGAPATPSCSSVDAGITNSDPSLTGGGARCMQIADPNAFQKDFYHNFNTSAFTLASPGTFGNIGLGILRQPAWSNWDMTLEKKVQLGNNEKHMLRFRLEAYNVFNQTEFSSIGTGLSLRNGVNTSTTYGQYTGTRPPRQMSTTVRFEF